MLPYPGRLLPKSNSSIIGTVENEHLLLRSTEFSKSIFNNNGALKTRAIDYKNIGNHFTLSFNISPESIPHDTRIKLMDRSLNEYWNPGNPVRKVKYKEFTRIYQRQCFGVKVKKLCFKDSIPKALSRKKTVQVSFTVSIVHKPTIANYFHFQIEVIDSETKKPITWGKSAYQKAISKKIFDRILMHAEIVEKNWNRAWRLKDYLSLS